MVAATENPMKPKDDASQKGAERTCVACRTTQNPDAMLRVVLAPDGVTPHIDYLGRLPGRGAYVCPNMRCLEQAVQRGGLRRSFRKPVEGNADALMKQAWEASVRQIRSLLSLANRANKALPGSSRVEVGFKAGEAKLLLVAHDASAGVQRKFRRWATELEVPVAECLSKEEMGPSLGSSETAVALITDAGFATRIQQELERSKHLICIQD